LIEGKFPFQGNNKQEIYYSIIHDGPFPFQKWISFSFQELIRPMLNSVPDLRTNLAEVLSHSLFQQKLDGFDDSSAIFKSLHTKHFQLKENVSETFDINDFLIEQMTFPTENIFKIYQFDDSNKHLF
jgi:serine/threonine protein kinase